MRHQEPSQPSAEIKNNSSQPDVPQQTGHLNQANTQFYPLHLAKSVDRRLTQFTQPFNPFLNKLVEPLDPLLAKLTIYGLLLSSVSLAAFVSWNFVDRWVWPHTLTIAAGKEDGESYKLSIALAKVLQQYRHYPTINIEVYPTGGTEKNLEELEANPPGADLATAQADVVADKPHKSVRAVATLYRDYFQLLVNKNAFDIKDKDSPEAAFSKFIKKLNEPTPSRLKVIEVPAQGGQTISFKDIAKHYSLEENRNFIFRDFGGSQNYAQETEKIKKALNNGEISAVFRVRALGNHDISKYLLPVNDRDENNNVELLPIEQVAAMSDEHPAFQQTVEIPQGTYKGYPAIPAENLPTIAVQRLLLARKDVPDWIVREITEVLNEHRKEIADEVEGEVKPLTASIGEPGVRDGAGVALHPGALNFYRRQEPPLLDRLSIIGAIISIGSFALSILWQINIKLKKEKKNRADEHIGKVVNLMKPQTDLDGLIASQKQIEDVFHEASNDLRAEKISQESFRTFNEAYKTSREFIERAIEGQQRKRSAEYIEQVMNLLDRKGNADDLRELDGILMEAKQLLQKNIFSRESFRTFIEAYNVVKDTLKQREEERTTGSRL